MLKEGSPSKYFFLGMIGIIAVLSIIVIFPFLTSIITGAILAFVFYPLYTWMLKRINHRGIAAFITAVIIILLVTIPLIYLIQNLTAETHYMYIRAKQQLSVGELIESRCYDDNLVCNTINNLNDVLRDDTIKNYLLGLLNDFLAFSTKKVGNLIISLPKIIIHLLVTLFTTYYVLKDGKDLLKRIEKAAPLKVHHQEEIIKQFGGVTKAIIYGSFVVAIVQGTLGSFGLWLFGIKNFLWWGILMTFFALIPFIGTWVIWFPASIYLGLTGYLQGETGLIWRGVGLFFFGLLIISTVDNILKPIIVAERARVHPLLILIGILGGLFVFGFIGLILGPLLLALLQTLLEIYERERKPHIGEPEPDIIGNKDHHGTRR
jgi:predicted PurR-regulated permease PerM